MKRIDGYSFPVEIAYDQSVDGSCDANSADASQSYQMSCTWQTSPSSFITSLDFPNDIMLPPILKEASYVAVAVYDKKCNENLLLNSYIALDKCVVNDPVNPTSSMFVNSEYSFGF